MIRVVASNYPVEVGWAAFHAAAIRFHRIYANADRLHDTDADRARWIKVAQEVARLWDEWCKLFAAAEPRPAA